MTSQTIPAQLDAVPSHRDDMNELPRALWPHSKSATFKLALLMPLARHRAAATPAQVAVAHLVAAAYEDCGACLRIAKRQALKAGLSRAQIQAAIEDRTEPLADDLQLVHGLAKAVVEQASDAAALARQVAHQLGEKALTDLALAIAVARFFPTAKRGLGIAVSCSVGGTDV